MFVYGWIISSIASTIIGSCLGEISSSYPISGGLYYQVGAMSSKKNAPLASYITGWLYFGGNVLMNVSFAYGLSEIIIGFFYVSESRSDYFFTSMAVITSMFILTMWHLKNLIKISERDLFIDITGFYQILSTIVIIFVCFLLAPELSESSWVFTYYYNDTGFDSVSYVCLIGLLTSLYAFAGYEAGATMAEETKNPSVSAPRGILMTCIISAVFGFATVLALLYGCNENINYVLYGPGEPLYNLFYLVANGKKSVA